MKTEHPRPDYDTFLSSCFSDTNPADREGNRDLTSIREETRQKLSRAGFRAWTWEEWEASDAGRILKAEFAPKDVPIFRQIAVFRRALMESRTVIIFVSSRRGQQVQPWADGIETYGTYFEIEVFFAIALQKPIILFREKGASVDKPLEQLLAVAGRSKAIYHEETIKRSELPSKSLDALAAVDLKLRSPQARFTALLARRRDPALDFRSMMDFLYGVVLPPLDKHPDVGLVDRLIESEREPGLVLSERLSRLWLAIQELLPHRDQFPREEPLLERWLACLDRWSVAASWFGLHAHLGVSPLTSHADRARLILQSGNATAPLPFGPMASARYSIARREAIGPRRYREMKKVIADCQRAIEARDWDVAGAYAIQGHAMIYNGRLWAATEAFEKGLALRELEQDEGRIGEGKCDLGFALFVSGRTQTGLGLMEEGVRLLEASDRLGFHLKSLKKLELAYRATLKLDRARQIRRRRTERATQEEFFDQAD